MAEPAPSDTAISRAGRRAHQRKRRRTWIILAVVLAIALAVGVAVAVLLTTRDDAKSVSTSTTANTTKANGTTTTTADLPPDSSSTTSSTTTGGTSSAGTTLPMPSDPDGFATTLYAYWKAGDRAAASQVATPEAVNQMFSVAYPGPPDPYTFQGCKGAAGNAECTYLATGVPHIVMTVQVATGGIPVTVASVQRTG